MKILTRNGIALYKFLDSDEVVSTNETVSIPGLVIGDCNINNTILYEGVVDTPTDFIGHKYLYDGTWTLNPNYQEPEDIEEGV